MATPMSAQQVQAELQRKKNLGIAPTNSANMAQYNQIKPVTPQAAQTPKPSTGGAIPPMPGNGYSQVIAAGRAIQPSAYQPPQPSNLGVPGPMPSQSNINQSKGMASVYAAAPPRPPAASTVTNGFTPPMPTTGNGGADYNTADAATRRALEANTTRLKTDSAYAQSEIDRALKVKAQRVAQGMDTSAQDKYLLSLGYSDVVDTVAQPVVDPGISGPPTVNSPSPVNAVTTPRTSQDLQQEAGDGLKIDRAALDNAINTYLSGLQNDFNYSNQLITDSRVLENGMFQDKNDPFNKRTDFSRATLQRGRQIDDNQRMNEFNNQANSKRQELYNFDKLAPERQRQIYGELLEAERRFGLEVGSLTGSFAGQRTLAGQGLDLQRDQFDYGKTQDQIQNDAQYGGVYNGQKTADQKQREWQNRVDYGQVIGVMPNGQKTLQMQQFEQDRKNYGDEWAYKVARDSISDKQWQQEFDEDTRRYGLDYGLRRATEKRVAANQASGGSGGGGNGAASGGVPNSGPNGDPNYPVAGPIKDPELRSQSSAMESLLDRGKMTYDQVVAEINQGVKDKFFDESEAAYLMNIANRYKPKTIVNPKNPFGLPGIG